MAKQKPIILSDESVNSYGFRVLTSGIALTAFQKNPVMLYNHGRDRLPIGRWEDITVENGKLIASPNFDDTDTFAQQVQSKYMSGVLNAASVGIDIVDLSDDPALLAHGQRRPTVTKSELFEASIADIPVNKNAVKLHFSSRGIALSGDIPEALLTDYLPLLHKPKNMKQIALKLGLPETATETEIVAAIDRQNLKLQGATEAGIKTLLSIAERKGFAKESIHKLAKLDFETTFEMVTAAPDKTTTPAPPSEGGESNARLSDLLGELQKLGVAPASTEGKSFSTLMKNERETLVKMYATNPTAVKLAYKKEFGIEPTEQDLSKILK